MYLACNPETDKACQLEIAFACRDALAVSSHKRISDNVVKKIQVFANTLVEVIQPYLSRRGRNRL